MANTGNGAKGAGATAPAATEERSTSSAPSAKPPTKKTSSATAAAAKPRQLKPVSQTEALEMLRSALVYLQLSGVGMRYRENEAGLLLQLDQVRLDGVRFVVTPSASVVSAVVSRTDTIAAEVR